MRTFCLLSDDPAYILFDKPAYLLFNKAACLLSGKPACLTCAAIAGGGVTAGRGEMVAGDWATGNRCMEPGVKVQCVRQQFNT